MNRIPGLDALRAFAVFFVIIEHFGVWFDDTSVSGKIIRHIVIPDGGFGVHLFFVLSGFLITAILLQAKRSGDAGTVIKTFYLRRMLRIFPIYYLLLFFLLAINFPDVRRYFPWFASYTSNILCYRNNAWNMFGHTWTLAVEEQFYLLWPWLIIFVNDRLIPYILYGSIITGIVTTYFSFRYGHFAPLLVYHTFDAFGIGALYAWAKQHNYNRRFEQVLSIIIIPTIIFYIHRKASLAYTNHAPGAYLSKTVNGIIAIWLITLVINNKSKLADKYLFSNRVLTYIGRISYGIYLYHFVYIGYFFSIVNRFFYNITLPYPALNKIVHDHHTDYWIELGIMIGIASISYHLIEKPLLNLKKRFSYAKTQRLPVTLLQTSGENE